MSKADHEALLKSTKRQSGSRWLSEVFGPRLSYWTIDGYGDKFYEILNMISKFGGVLND